MKKEESPTFSNQQRETFLFLSISLFFMSAALSPATIASAAVAVARAARQYLDALSDAQSESVT